jgi:hypothetical protein
MKKVLLVTVVLFCFNLLVGQTTYRSTGSGSWSTNSTWSTNSLPIGRTGGSYVPGAGSTSRNQIIIEAGHTVTLNFSALTGSVRSILVSGDFPVDLIIYGTLQFSGNAASTDQFILPATKVGSNSYYSRIVGATGGKLIPNCGGNSGVTCGANDAIWTTKTSGGGVTDARLYRTSLGQILSGTTNTETNPVEFAQGIPLPVTFGSIKASEKGTGVQIDWTSYSESNLANYQIERSIDGINFTSVGEVAPRNVAEATNYNFFDALPLSGTNFYRIRNNDIDGKSGLSNIVKINLNKNIKTIGVYPNPVLGNRVSFQTSDLAMGTYNVEVINAMGSRVFQQSVNHAGGAINQSLNLPTLQSGQYTLRINGTSSSSIHKITILQ